MSLNSSGYGPEIAIEIYDYHVALAIPYIYRGTAAEKAFNKLRLYLDIIHKTAGYFVYDPRTGETFNPAAKEFDGLPKYLSGVWR